MQDKHILQAKKAIILLLHMQKGVKIIINALKTPDLHQEKKNLPTIFRLGARAISTCLVLLVAAWQSIGKWGN